MSSLTVHPDEVTGPFLAQKWGNTVGSARPQDYKPDPRAGKKLMPHQVNIIQWQGSVMKRWSEDGALPYRGLLAFHNVGAGKTAEMVGMLLMTRIYKPNAMVIFVATKDQLGNLFGADIAKDYKLFDARIKRLAGGPEAIAGVNEDVFFSDTMRLPRYDPKTKSIVRDRRKATKGFRQRMNGCWYMTSFGYVDEFNTPAVVGFTIEEFAKMNNELKNVKRLGSSTKSWLPVDLAENDAVFLFDEAHNLQKPPKRIGKEFSTNYPLQYTTLRDYFCSPESMGSSYLVLMTATPATTVPDFLEMSKMLVYGPAQKQLDSLRKRFLYDGSLQDHVLLAWGRIMRGTIDAFQALNNFYLYPKLRFQSTGGDTSPMQSQQRVEDFLTSSPQMTDTAWIEQFLSEKKPTDAERKYVGTFNPAFDPTVKRAKDVKGAVRRNRVFFTNHLKKMCRNGNLDKFSPKLAKLRSNLQQSGRGKHFIACQSLKPSYDSSLAVEIMLRDCLGFELLDVHKLCKGVRSLEAVKRRIAEYLRAAPRKRRYWSTNIASKACPDKQRQLLYWLAIRSDDGDTLGAFNLDENNEGGLLEVVIINRSTLAEGTSIRMLRNIHIFDVVPMDTFGQIIGRGQRPYAFAAEKNVARRVINVLVYATRWEDSLQRELYRIFTERLAVKIHIIDGKTPWVRALRRRLAALAAQDSHNSEDARRALRMLSELMQVTSRPTSKRAVGTLPVEGYEVLTNFQSYIDVLRMFTQTMRISNNCVQASLVHKKFGMFAGGLGFEQSCDDGAFAGVGDASVKGVILDLGGNSTFTTRLFGNVGAIFGGRIETVLSKISGQDLIDKRILMRAMEKEYGPEAAPAAYETFVRFTKDLLYRS